MDNKTAITKSTRHGNILGKFGEYCVLNWLSRSGFEAVYVDHTGIDILAYRKDVGRIGITVKSRTRQHQGTEADDVNLLEKKDELLLKKAGEDFNCAIWIALYIEKQSSADLYLCELNHFKNNYHKEGNKVVSWKMRKNG